MKRARCSSVFLAVRKQDNIGGPKQKWDILVGKIFVRIDNIISKFKVFYFSKNQFSILFVFIGSGGGQTSGYEKINLIKFLPYLHQGI